jgi:hypothetical protein
VRRRAAGRHRSRESKSAAGGRLKRESAVTPNVRRSGWKRKSGRALK